MLYKKIVVKIGSQVITDDKGQFELGVIANIVDQIVKLKKQGAQIIIVSSGSIAAGKTLTKSNKKINKLVERQVFAATGQLKIMNTYIRMFSNYSYLTAQVLATKEDFRDRKHYLNMQNCFNGLLQDEIIPIVNENDVISINELMFSDNDELAGLIASMMDADALIFLTNVDGVFDMNPKEKDAKLLENIEPTLEYFDDFVDKETSIHGRGGMLSKCKLAHKLALIGITSHIANGKHPNVLTNIFDGKMEGSKFLPQKKVSHVKKWLASTKGYEKGAVYINEGAQEALMKKKSLLPVGIVKIEGKFEKGDIIQIRNLKNEDVGLGTAQYGSDEASGYLGKNEKKAFIHYDYLFLETCSI